MGIEITLEQNTFHALLRASFHESRLIIHHRQPTNIFNNMKQFHGCC
jgi:hypothetical protein